jgi:hypothetical protein
LGQNKSRSIEKGKIMKTLLLVSLILFFVSACAMGKPNIDLKVYNGVPTQSDEQPLRADGQTTNPSVNNPVSALSSSGGVTIIIKQQTVDINTPVGVNASIPASSLGGL